MSVPHLDEGLVVTLRGEAVEATGHLGRSALALMRGPLPSWIQPTKVATCLRLNSQRDT